MFKLPKREKTDSTIYSHEDVKKSLPESTEIKNVRSEEEIIESFAELIRQDEYYEASIKMKNCGISGIVDKVVLKLNETYNSIDENSWVWVDGYKGTDANMACIGFQFSMNKTYIADGSIEECRNGFHLCRELEKTLTYYNPINAPCRYFKVRALVRKKDLYKLQNKIYEKYENRYVISNRYDPDRYRIVSKISDKLVSKQIIFTEEIDFDMIKQYLPTEFNIDRDKWSDMLKAGSYENYFKGFIKEDMLEFGISETLATIILGNKVLDELPRVFRFRDKFIGLVESGVSMDMCLYLLKEYL